MTFTGKGLQIRFEAGEILGALGDPRIDNYPMVHVEGGEFIMGSDEDEMEQPIHKVYLDEFMIGKYPVTNQEFKEFIDDEGYKNKELWPPEGWNWREKENILEPLYWHDRKWNGPNFPVVGVSWYEASAYATWLSKMKRDNYSLPTEAQWEKAARGINGLIYPWGNEFHMNLCNSSKCGLNRTSPVGLFQNGRSPYGCMDMAGNVLEWCFDFYGKNYYKKSSSLNPRGPSSSADRIVRGGSWTDTPWNCRAACRSADPPSRRNFDIGFRLVRLI
jgi:formylglycine-generating enzyme required for sulfatase activity